MPDAIVFDLGGVLIDWNPRYLFRNLFPDAGELEWFLSTVCSHEWNLQQDKGRPISEGVRLLQQSFPAHSNFIALYYERWEEMLRGTIPETVNILHELKFKPYRLLALTNWSAETFPKAQEKFPFLSWFEDIIVSGTEKLIKPDPEIFYLLLKRHQLSPNRCLFIDDNLSNIETAAQIGFQVIHFTSAVLLQEQLRHQEVL